MTARFQGPTEPELQAGGPALRALAREGFDAEAFDTNGLDTEGFDANEFNASGLDADAFKSPSAFFAWLGVTERTVMRHQVVELILDILGATAPESEVRLRLLRHLAAHRGCPEQALLCHLLENARLPLSTAPGCAPAEAPEARSPDAFGGWSPGCGSRDCTGPRTGLFRLPDWRLRIEDSPHEDK